jgi:hypothetical protein
MDWSAFFYWLVALLLAIPASIVANLATPTVSRWWSHTSINRAKKRLVVLNARLARRQEFQQDWAVLVRFLGVPLVRGFSGLVTVVVVTGGFTAWVGATTLELQLKPDVSHVNMTQATYWLAIILFVSFDAWFSFHVALLRVSQYVLSDINGEIEKLSAWLSGQQEHR